MGRKGQGEKNTLTPTKSGSKKSPTTENGTVSKISRASLRSAGKHRHKERQRRGQEKKKRPGCLHSATGTKKESTNARVTKLGRKSKPKRKENRRGKKKGKNRSPQKRQNTWPKTIRKKAKGKRRLLESRCKDRRQTGSYQSSTLGKRVLKVQRRTTTRKKEQALERKVRRINP